jgi:hypothetical protein
LLAWAVLGCKAIVEGIPPLFRSSIGELAWPTFAQAWQRDRAIAQAIAETGANCGTRADGRQG